MLGFIAAKLFGLQKLFFLVISGWIEKRKNNSCTKSSASFFFIMKKNK